MFGSQLLDTTIGMFFVLLLVSLLVTTANEMVAAAFRSRAKWLRKGIERLLGSEWMMKMYAHPLIDSTSFNSAGAGPSYIPSRTYATVLLELVHQSEPCIRNVRNALHDALHKTPTETVLLSGLKEVVLQ